MNEQLMIESLATSAGRVPTAVDIVGLQQFSTEEMQARTRRLLSQVAERSDCSLDRGDWQADDEHTLIRLPEGARAVLYHASGSMIYTSGLAPFAAHFERMEDKEHLIRQVNQSAKEVVARQWVGNHGELVFERLWQMKAQGADLQGNSCEPLLTRVVGAYRQVVDGLPVLGAASVALRLAGNGALDMLSVQARPSAAEVLEKAAIIAPELAARQLSFQLVSLLGPVRDLPEDVIESQSMQFGYLNLGKRKAQRLLAPAYVAQVVLRHKMERQAYILAVAATEKTYLPICHCGDQALPTASRKLR
ncbi:MAG: hypothetical protein ABIT83_14135 [Massilia sp.]